MRSTRAGATLFELLITLILLSVFFTIAFPSLRSARDALAVRAARETAFALFSRARMVALQQGGAEIELDARLDRMLIRSHLGVIEYQHNFSAQGVDLLLGSAPEPVTLRYDAHGLGRMMSRTVTFTAGSGIGGLTISAFGRVRRW